MSTLITHGTRRTARWLYRSSSRRRCGSNTSIIATLAPPCLIPHRPASTATGSSARGPNLPRGDRFASSMGCRRRRSTPIIWYPVDHHLPLPWRIPCSRGLRRRAARPRRSIRELLRHRLRILRRLMELCIVGQRRRKKMVRSAVAASVLGRVRRIFRFSHREYRSVRIRWKTCRRGRRPFSPLSLLHCMTVRHHPSRAHPRALLHRKSHSRRKLSTEPSQA